jgi:hypothetical protein
MRAMLRFLICLLVSCSIAFAVIPAQVAAPQIAKADCCAKLKTDTASNGCDRHAPKSDQDEQACSGCVFCLIAVLPATTALVYPPTGDESFAALLSCEPTRSHRPPVPPPRA